MRDIHIHTSEMRFYEREGWTQELLESVLDEGELHWDTAGFWRLAHTPSPASFNVQRLSDLAGDVLDHKQVPMKPKEKAIYMRYYSQHGVFKHGQRF